MINHIKLQVKLQHYFQPKLTHPHTTLTWIVKYYSRGPSKAWVFLKFQWRPSWMLCKKSLVESPWQAVGTGQIDMLITSASPGANCLRSFPSKEAHAWPLLLKGTWILSVTCSGNIRGRKDNECGQIGVNKMPGTCTGLSYVRRYQNVNIVKAVFII